MVYPPVATSSYRFPPPPIMPVTQRDIAEHVGLSQQAISFALNGSTRISVETRDRVLRAATQLGYRQNQSASAMRRGRFHSLAYLSSTHRSRSYLSVPFWSGLQEALGERDLHLVTSKLSDADFSDPAYVPKVLRELSSDGAIIHYTQEIPGRLIDLVRDHNVPCIWANTRLDHDCVRPDDVAAGRLAAEHLLGLGHRRIVLVTLDPALHYSVDDRRDGFVGACRGAGVTPQVISVDRGATGTKVRPMLNALLDTPAGERVTAVAALRERDAMLICWSARERGLAVPRDLSVLAFDDDRPRDLLGFRLAAVHIPQFELGRAAVEQVMQKVTDPGRRLEPLLLPPELVLGDTVGPPLIC